MTQADAIPEATDKRLLFFRLIFGVNNTGYVCISLMRNAGGKKSWEDHFYKYPEEIDNLLHKVNQSAKSWNVYFCPQLFKSPTIPAGQRSARYKDNIKYCPSAWADLDSAKPELMLVKPSVIIESSANRYQALWLFDGPKPPAVAEQISKNIAYHHVPDGADSSGWDLTQLLRVPGTFNLKYALPYQVKIEAITKTFYRPEDFDQYQESRITQAADDPMPVMLPTEPALDIIQKYRRSINPIIFSLFDVEPKVGTEDGGWSKPLWQLQMLCFEAGMSREEVFVVAGEAACNKYKRDRKHPRLLWQEVCRAYATTVEKFNIIVPETEKLPSLISEQELERVAGIETFIEKYIKWASNLGDAATQYHQAGAFMILSSLLAGNVRLPTSFGTIMPNLWFMLLADTTLTRKSTAMDIAMDLVDAIDDDILLATDGSLEGLMQSMELRPGRPSVFQRDEFSGLIESMTRKDYMAGMPEALTKLYDGKTMKRVLKRETITVKEPCLLIFGAGIMTRVQSLLTLEHVASGFVPRFIFITAESDVSKLRPLGPPTPELREEREVLVEEAKEIRERYVRTNEILLKGKIIETSVMHTMAELTPDAWARYNQLEATLLYAGVNSDQPDIMTPVYDRLAKSILKASVLIAASRGKDDVISVTLEDLLIAMKYGTEWRDYALTIVNGIGRSTNEVQLQRIYKSIKSHPGVTRSRLMQWYHLEARAAETIFATLEQRGMIVAARVGRTWAYEAIGRIEVNGKG